MPGGSHVDCALELVLQFDWGFADLAVTKEGGNDEQLEIKRKPLYGQQRNSFREDLPAEQFQASLGVANVQVEQYVHDQLIDGALKAAEPGVCNLRRRMPFGSNHRVALRLAH